ncbi:MAG: phosphoglycerate dehydrogenase [Acidimicrobiia bacterium]|nr:phosphoglycerate dehydrogenase [Acidimicrobiia bacterium]
MAEAGLKALAESCEVDNAAGLDRAALLARMPRASGLVVRSATQVDAELIHAAPMLQVIGRAGIGVDNIDLEAATQAGVLVVNAPQANVISAAEHTVALILAQARNIPRADAALRGGTWDRKNLQGVELHGKTLGVIGLGRIGSLVADRARSFGMRLIGFDPYVAPDVVRRMGMEIASDLAELFATADFITMHLPKTRETENLLNAAAFDAMKPGVRIVNTSRGGIVDEAALAEAIRSGRVAGAALDVFADEPLTDSPLFALSQVVLTPHLGASTVEAQDKAGTDVAAAVAAALSGDLVLSAVNVDLGRDVNDEVRSFLPLAESLGRVFVSIAKGLPETITIGAVGRIAGQSLTPLRLAALKGALWSSSDESVSYVNAERLAQSRGIRIVEEKSEDAEDFVSLIRLSGTHGGQPVSVAGTVTRKGPMLVEIQGLEVELPLHRNLLIVRNEDVPGLIGRVGTFLGQADLNISDMVVGRMPGTGEAAMMGIAIDQPMTDDQVQALRSVQGVITVRFVELATG